MDFVKALQDNWAVLSTAPWAFATIVVLFGGGGLLIGRLWQSGVITNLESRIALRDDRIADYERKLDVASPDEAKQRLDALEKQIRALGPRTLSPDQMKAIGRRIAGQSAIIEITHDMAAADAKALTAAFAVTFQRAGWKTIQPMVMGLGNHPPSGLALQVANPSQLRPIENTVKQALEDAGIEYDIQSGLRAGSPMHGVEDQTPDVGLLLTTRLA